MRKPIIFSIVLYLCSFSTLGQHLAAGDKNRSSGKTQYVLAPTTSMLLTIAYQPDCPIRIEEARYLLRADGSVSGQMTVAYRVRNVSRKPISGFIVGAWSGSGGGGEKLIDLDKPLMPGKTFETMQEARDYELISMTTQVRAGLKPEDEMKFFLIVLASRVHFADGSTYNDQRTSDALRKFLNAGSP